MKFLPNILYLSLELHRWISGASSSRISPHLIHVDSHALLFQFHAKFLNFHGPFYFLSHPYLCVLAHAEIRIFSAYRAGHTLKKHWNPRTYAAVLRAVTYRAANKVFKGKNWSKLWFFVQDGVRVEGKRAWWCGGGCARWSYGPTSITGMWFIQVLVSLQPKGQTKTTPAAGGLLGSRI